MHVLMTVNAAWNIWHFRRPVVAALLADGCKVSVLAPADASVSELQALGCDVIPLEMDVKGLNPARDLALLRRFRRVFGDLRPDVILSYTIKNNLFGAMAARRCGIPFIPNVTGLGTAFLSGGLLQRIAEGLYRHAFADLSCVFFQNEEDRDLFVQRNLVRKQQARLLPGSGVDLAHFAPAPTQTAGLGDSFLMIARLLRDKGVVEYVEAARQVRQQYPAARFRLLGATGIENRTAIGPETIAAWVGEGVIDYLGTTDDVRPHIAAADCVVLPSYREGAPRTLIEAAAMARPAITTDVPGCRSVVEAGVTGLLCAPRDAVSLAETCARFLSLPPEARTAMGQAGRRRMEARYDQSIVVSEYRMAIADALGRNSSRIALAS